MVQIVCAGTSLVRSPPTAPIAAQAFRASRCEPPAGAQVSVARRAAGDAFAPYAKVSASRLLAATWLVTRAGSVIRPTDATAGVAGNAAPTATAAPAAHSPC